MEDPNISGHGDADQHLQRLLLKEPEKPWFLTMWHELKEYIRPPKLPPLEVTSKPVAVRDIWGFSGGHGAGAGVSSMLIHGAVVALMIVVSLTPAVQNIVKEHVILTAPIDIAPYEAPKKPQKMGGGGGGGDRSPTPASKGKLPKAAPRQFVPPAAVVNNPNPKLVLDPTIIVPTDAQLPNVNMAVWGDPLGKVGLPSNGTGSGGGIGSGSGGGVGSGKGGGFGPGEGGGVGGGVYRPGGGVTNPVLLARTEPEYSEEARKAKFQGTVVLTIVVDEKGNPRDIVVSRPLGLGLDEKAVEAVAKWRFRPGFFNGKAVAVRASVEVNFRLL